MKDKKYCPLTGQDCKECDCAWYIPPQRITTDVTILGKCAVLDIAKSVDFISQEP